MSKDTLVPLPPQQPGHRGYKKKPVFPKFKISSRIAGEAVCVLDGQSFDRHSKKNMMRHIFYIQNSFIESQKGQADLRSDITRYEKKFGKLKPEKADELQKTERKQAKGKTKK